MDGCPQTDPKMGTVRSHRLSFPQPMELLPVPALTRQGMVPGRREQHQQAVGNRGARRLWQGKTEPRAAPGGTAAGGVRRRGRAAVPAGVRRRHGGQQGAARGSSPRYGFSGAG